LLKMIRDGGEFPNSAAPVAVAEMLKETQHPGRCRP
jgi:hypothetical protein